MIFCDTIIEDTYSKQCFIDEESVVLSSELFHKGTILLVMHGFFCIEKR